MYIVIETHGGAEYATIVTNEDGSNKVFDHWKEAHNEADDCQDGLVIGIGRVDPVDVASHYLSENKRSIREQLSLLEKLGKDDDDLFLENVKGLEPSDGNETVSVGEFKGFLGIDY